MTKKLLEGIKVADFSWVIAGPLMTKTLGDCGAEIIRIEGRTRYDIERNRFPYKGNIPGVNRAIDYNQNNTSKLSVALNLSKPKGKEVAKKLVAWADIVVENFAGGAMNRMGLGYEELKKVNPDIIMLSTCMQGQWGPHAAHPGFGHQLTALSGFHHIAGWPDREPQHMGAYTDFVSVHFGVMALMAALEYRARTGKGQYMDMSQYEVGVQFQAPNLLDYLINGRVAYRQGNAYSYAAPHGAFRCRGNDRWCAIAVFKDDEWNNFCRVIGNPPWTNDVKFSTLPARKENEDELNKLVEEWTAHYLAEEVMILMQKAGVAAGLVETSEDVLDHDPQFKYSKFAIELDHPEVGKYRVFRPPFLASKGALGIKRTPLLGEHNEYVCREVLGMSDDEIAKLIIDGVLE